MPISIKGLQRLIGATLRPLLTSGIGEILKLIRQDNFFNRLKYVGPRHQIGAILQRPLTSGTGKKRKI